MLMVPTIQQFSLLCIWVYFGACFAFGVYTGLNSDGAKGVNKAMGLFAFSFITRVINLNHPSPPHSAILVTAACLGILICAWIWMAKIVGRAAK